MTNPIEFTKPFKACDADLDLVTYPVMVLPKIDGVRGLCPNATLLGRSLKPHKNEYTKAVYSDAVYNGIDGEFAIMGQVTSQSLCRDTTSALNTIKGQPELTWWAFDLLSEEAIHLPYFERYMRLRFKVEQLQRHVKLVEFKWANNKEQVMDLYHGYIADGYEGVVLRDPLAMHKNGRSTKKQAGYLRLKPCGDAEGYIMGFDEAMHNDNEAKINELGEKARSSHKENKSGLGMIGAIWLRPINGGEPFKVGPGCMTHTQRIEFFNNPELYMGKIVKFKFFDHGAKDAYRHARFFCFRAKSDMAC